VTGFFVRGAPAGAQPFRFVQNSVDGIAVRIIDLLVRCSCDGQLDSRLVAGFASSLSHLRKIQLHSRQKLPLMSRPRAPWPATRGNECFESERAANQCLTANCLLLTSYTFFSGRLPVQWMTLSSLMVIVEPPDEVTEFRFLTGGTPKISGRSLRSTPTSLAGVSSFRKSPSPL